LIAITIGTAVQLLFVVLVGDGTLTLDYSGRFAAAGVPCCLLAAILAKVDDSKSLVRTGVFTSVVLGLAMWLFLITLH